MIEAPPSYQGPVPRGLLVAEAAQVAVADKRLDAVVFVNETWMWRRVDEKPTLIESPVARWFHGMMARWLVVRGIGAVTKRP